MPSSSSGPLSLWVKCQWALRGQQPATLLCKGMTHRAQKKRDRRGGEEAGRQGRAQAPHPPPPTPQLELLHFSLPQMGPNAKELFRLVEDFVDVIGFRMKDLRDAYQVTDNLGKPPPMAWFHASGFLPYFSHL